MTKIKREGSRLYVIGLETQAVCDSYRNSSGKIWAEAYDCKTRKQSFLNPDASESVIIHSR